MRIGLRLPQYGAGWDTVVDVARALARGGVDHLWVNDHLQSPGRRKAEPTWEAFTTLAALAPLVADVRLGVAVASASYRPAPLLAKMATVVDVISSGRMILGLGTGSDRPEHAAYGFPLGTPAERTARVRATLTVLRAMAAHPEGADVPGVLAGAPNLPAAVQPGGVPVWLAAHGPVLLRTAGRQADGVVAAWVGADDLRARVAIAREAAEAAGRRLPVIALYTFALAVPSREEALGWLRPEAEALGTTPESVLRWATGRGLVGPSDELRDRLAPLTEAGATDVILALPERAAPEAYAALLAALSPAPAPVPAAPVVTVAHPDVSPRANLVHLLVQRHRDAGRGALPAVIDDQGTWTYDELADGLARAAGALAAAGVRRGDRVGVVLRDGRPWVAAFLGAAALGAVPVPVDPLSGEERIALVLDDCEPAVVVAADDTPVAGHPRLDPAALAEGAPLPVRAVHPDDLAYLIYSSGSTGRPKGVMHAHRDLEVAVEGYAREVLGLGPGERTHSMARLFSSLGFGNGFFRPLGRGATAVLSGARPNPRGTLDLVEREGVTVLTAVPAFWAQLATFLDRHGRAEALASVRVAVSSGDALPPAVAERLRDAAGVPLVEGLGCSECSNIVLSTRPGDPAGGTLGRPTGGVEISLRDPGGRPVAEGEPGRLWIRSASNTTGYWRRIAVTRDLVHGEWIRLGDVLECREGVYRHVGRADDMFKVDARWVSPTEVEACLMELPEVAEAAVAGLPDEAGLPRVHAWVVAEGEAVPEAAELRRHVARRLAPHMAPQALDVLPELPRLPSGKVDRRALRAAAGGA